MTLKLFKFLSKQLSWKLPLETAQYSILKFASASASIPSCSTLIIEVTTEETMNLFNTEPSFSSSSGL